MKVEIKPGVVCFIVPPNRPGYAVIANRVCEVVSLFVNDSKFGGVTVYSARPNERAWVVRLPAPVQLIDGLFQQIPIYESWLRPISGPDIDISEHDATLTPRRQVEHSR